MTIDLATAYKRTGLEENEDNDAVLTATINVCLAAIEQYLDRKFLYGAQIDKFYYTKYAKYDLTRYPVEEIRSISPSFEYEVHHNSGVLVLPAHFVTRRLKIEYVGGYRVVPADLEQGFWITFDAVYGGQDPSYLAAGSISSITVPDVGTIRYSSDYAEDQSSGSYGVIPVAAVNLITPYKRYSC